MAFHRILVNSKYTVRDYRERDYREAGKTVKTRETEGRYIYGGGGDCMARLGRQKQTKETGKLHLGIF